MRLNPWGAAPAYAHAGRLANEFAQPGRAALGQGHMKPVRRELLNGLFVLVVASLLSVAFAAFQLKLDVQLWVLILMCIAFAVSG
jgi:hypothetical protein